MNVVSQTITPDAITLIVTSGREYVLTKQMLRAAYLAAGGENGEKRAAAVAACKAVRGVLKPKSDHLFAVRYRDKAKEEKALDDDKKKSKAERDAESDAESPFLSAGVAWTITFDAATGDIDPARTGWEYVT